MALLVHVTQFQDKTFQIVLVRKILSKIQEIHYFLVVMKFLEQECV